MKTTFQMSVAAAGLEYPSGQRRQFQPLLLIVFIDSNFIAEQSVQLNILKGSTERMNTVVLEPGYDQ